MSRAASLKAESAVGRDHRPIYIRVAETLRARVLSGYYTDMLDGEIKLAQEWRVSRRTIQQAIEILSREGLIERQQGAGTFINPRGVAKRYRAITSITASIRAQGLDVSYRILASGLEKADDRSIAFFGLGSGGEVYRHIRLIMADGRPVAVADTRLNAELLARHVDAFCRIEMGRVDAEIDVGHERAQKDHAVALFNEPADCLTSHRAFVHAQIQRVPLADARLA